MAMSFEDAIKLARTMCTPEAIGFTQARNEYLRACDRLRKCPGDEVEQATEIKEQAAKKLQAKREAFMAVYS